MDALAFGVWVSSGVARVLGPQPKGPRTVPDDLQAFPLQQAHRAAPGTPTSYQDPGGHPVQGLPPRVRVETEDVEPDPEPFLLHVCRGGGASVELSGDLHSQVHHYRRGGTGQARGLLGLLLARLPALQAASARHGEEVAEPH